MEKMRRTRSLVLLTLLQVIIGSMCLWGDFDGGEESTENPYQNSVADHLRTIDFYADVHLIQINNIDLSIPPRNNGNGSFHSRCS